VVPDFIIDVTISTESLWINRLRYGEKPLPCLFIVFIPGLGRKVIEAVILIVVALLRCEEGVTLELLIEILAKELREFGILGCRGGRWCIYAVLRRTDERWEDSRGSSA
jgi:hypothetical protein